MGEKLIVLLMFIVIFCYGHARKVDSGVTVSEKVERKAEVKHKSSHYIPEASRIHKHHVTNDKSFKVTTESLKNGSEGPVDLFSLPRTKQKKNDSNKEAIEYESTHDVFTEEHDNITLEDTSIKKKKTKLSNRHKGDMLPLEGKERPLSVGDTFTPRELLPVAVKLMEKVDLAGQGKGIVSKEKRPEDLADKLFEAFFFTTKRIAILNEKDIVGLDALQALALSGNEADKTKVLREPITPASNQATISFKGQNININKEPKKSMYLLLKKVDRRVIRKKTVIRRGGIELAKKLKKNRKLVVKTERRNLYHKVHSKNKSKRQGGSSHLHRLKSLKLYSKKVGQPKHRSITKARVDIERNRKNKASKSSKNSRCHWTYQCSNPLDLDTCRLQTQCNKAVEFHGLEHKPDEHSKSIRQFRKMLGISLIDEEVEKILERREQVFENQGGRDHLDRAESLGEYFKRVIMAESRKTTSPFTTMAASLDDNITPNPNERNQLDNGQGGSEGTKAITEL